MMVKSVEVWSRVLNLKTVLIFSITEHIYSCETASWVNVHLPNLLKKERLMSLSL
jgi:hypothetical protein